MVSFLTGTMVCGFSLYHILAYFLIYSCMGWCLEVIYAAATTGQLVNRGFLNGPVCPIYGFGMIIVLFVLTPLQHSILLLYIGGVILPSALELVGGWALYKLYHTRWWDYSDFPFNIGGYICLEFCLLWGVGTLVVMRIVHPVVADLVALIPPFVGVILMCFLYAVYAVDVVATAIAASALADTLDTMEQLGDSIHAVSDAMTQLLGTTTLTADQKLDEGRLQFKLAAAEARDAAGKRPSARETLAAIRAKAAEASEAVDVVHPGGRFADEPEFRQVADDVCRKFHLVHNQNIGIRRTFENLFRCGEFIAGVVTQSPDAVQVRIVQTVFVQKNYIRHNESFVFCYLNSPIRSRTTTDAQQQPKTAGM